MRVLGFNPLERSGGYFYVWPIDPQGQVMNAEQLEELRETGQDIIETIMAERNLSFPEAVEEVTAWLIGEILGVDVERVTLH